MAVPRNGCGFADTSAHQQQAGDSLAAHVDQGRRPVSCGQGAGNCWQPGPEVPPGPGQEDGSCRPMLSSLTRGIGLRAPAQATTHRQDGKQTWSRRTEHMFNQNTWSRRTEVVGKRQSTRQQVRSIFSTEAGGQPVL